MHLQLLSRRLVLLTALGTAVTGGCTSARQAVLTTLPPGHAATLYSSKTQEPIAVVVTPPGTAFAVKADPGMTIRPLAPAEFATLVRSLEPVQDSRFLPADVHVLVAFRHARAVTIEGSHSGVRAVVADPVDANIGGGSGGPGGGGGGGGKGGSNN